ncbi:site-specific integrase [Acaricomes phytoseiuli]|uniref:tyrosine-type recombinase/integrase n=1 Tax=Acaricomes phytoseiuli TaxID=291968 RepID=UPI000A04B8C8|nr:site-specific integrase [Acaricomes phytoseiuli]MCW1250436.1 site-specific integrase [Acaricomes phytoseiuli]
MRGLVGVNVAENVTAPRPSNFSPQLLGIEDAKKLLASISGDEDEARWIVALALGLRQGEVLGMGWDQVDLRAGNLRVTRSLYRLPWAHGCHEKSCGKAAWRCPQRQGGGVFIGEPKSKAAVRTISLPGPLIEALTALQETQKRWRIEEGERWTGFTDDAGRTVDLVFSTRLGAARNYQDDWTEWKALLANAGVPSVRLHDARHTAATVLLALNVQPRVVMNMMGWTAVSMTTRYQHVVDEMLKDASRRVEDALWSAPGKGDPPTGAEVISLENRRSLKRRKPL